MKTVQISLNSIDKVKSFVNAITQFNFDFDLISGRYVIDAKSITRYREKSCDFSRVFFYSSQTVIVSVVSMAVCISSSIFSFRCCSERSIIFRFGFVTGCFATKIVQQSSNG